MQSSTISNIAFAGVFVAIGLAVFGVVQPKHGIFLAAGLVAVGLLTKPSDATA